MEKDREVRYQTAADLKADLKRAARERVGPVRSLDCAVAEAGSTAVWIGIGCGGEHPTIGGLVLGFFYPRPADTNPALCVQLTDLPAAVQPALSSDGPMLTFIGGPDAFFGRGEIYVKLLSDGVPKQLTHDGLSKMGPVFSPDRSRIAYTRLTAVSTGTSWW